MALGTIVELREAIGETLERDDLAGEIDNFIVLAEAQHSRDIRIREMLTRAALTVDDRHVTIPTGMLEGKTLRLLTDPRTVLTNISNAEMDCKSRSGTGKPLFYTIHADIEFDIAADQSYSGELVYYADFTPLDDANPTNVLLTRAPDAYLYGALLHSAPYLHDDPRLNVWAGLYGAARDSLNHRKDTRIGPQVSKVYGATP